MIIHEWNCPLRMVGSHCQVASSQEMSARLFCLRQIPSKVGVTRCHICSLFTLIMRCCHFDYSAHTWATLQTGASLTLNLLGFCDSVRGIIEQAPSQTDIYACRVMALCHRHSTQSFTVIIHNHHSCIYAIFFYPPINLLSKHLKGGHIEVYCTWQK